MDDGTATTHLTATIELWKNIYSALEHDPAEGMRQFKERENSCPLCNNYKKVSFNEDHVYISCKGCPICAGFRRTCYSMFAEYGYEPERDGGDVEKTKQFVEKVIGSMELLRG
jgi:hypothetical protein